jgi:hypothetical protein
MSCALLHTPDVAGPTGRRAHAGAARRQARSARVRIGASLAWTDVAFELDAAEEPRVRGFFSKVAQSAGRLGPA